MELVLKTLIIVAVGVFVAWFARFAAKRPNRAKKDRNRIRAPKLLAFVGWLFVVVGAVFTLAAFTTPSTSTGAPMPLGAKITAVALVVVGAIFLYGYFRWYTVIGAEQIEFRRMFTGPRTIKYADIVDHKLWQQNAQWFLKVKAIDGTSASLNVTMFKADALLEWLEFKGAVGRNPNSQEIHTFHATGTWPPAAIAEAQARAAVQSQVTGINQATGQRNARSPRKP